MLTMDCLSNCDGAHTAGLFSCGQRDQINIIDESMTENVSKKIFYERELSCEVDGDKKHFGMSKTSQFPK